MTASDPQRSTATAPMPAEKRYGIATVSSLTFHLLVLLIVGLLAGRTPLPPEVLIPIELTMAEAAADDLLPGAGGHPEAALKTTSAPAPSAEPSKPKPSSPGGRTETAPAPPKVLTAKSSPEPAGPEGVGKEPAGPGGQEEVPAGPTRGPNIVRGALPMYPKDALDQGLQGTVALSVLVAKDGSITSVKAAKSSGHESLDRAAQRAIERGWTFEPALENGKPVPGKRTVTFVFSAGAGEAPPTVTRR